MLGRLMRGNLRCSGIHGQAHPDPLQHRDDGKRQAGRNQTVFHCGRATLVGSETLNYLAHLLPTGTRFGSPAGTPAWTT
jgi:hypothetical protein